MTYSREDNEGGYKNWENNGERREHARKDKGRADRAAMQDNINPGKETDCIESEDTSLAINQDNSSQEPQERRERSHKKHRSGKHKNYHGEGQRPEGNENLAVEDTRPAAKTGSGVNTDKAEDDHSQDGQQTERTHYKKNYYRNRRRNRPEGAKEQHES